MLKNHGTDFEIWNFDSTGLQTDSWMDRHIPSQKPYGKKGRPSNKFSLKVQKSVEKHRPWLIFTQKEYRSRPGAPPLATLTVNFKLL